MKAKQIYRKYKASISTGKWLKRYLAKRTCRWGTAMTKLKPCLANVLELFPNYREQTTEENEAYDKFIDGFFDEMKDLDPEYSKVVDHFWELA